MTKRDVKDSLELQSMFAKRSEALKVPKIIKTSPPKERESHEKYSMLTSAAITISYEAMRGRGFVRNEAELQMVDDHKFKK